MELKKNPSADLNRKSGLFLNIGLVISLVLVITAFEWKYYDDGSLVDLGQVDDEFEDIMDIPPTEQPPPPPPKVQQPEIIEVPDDEEIEEVIEIDLDIEVIEETVIEEVVFEEAPEEEVRCWKSKAAPGTSARRCGFWPRTWRDTSRERR